MKTKIETYKYVKQIEANIEVDLPDTVEYHFQTGIRRSIAIIPVYTTWNKEQYNREEEIWRYDFVCVYGSFENKIERSYIQVNQISDIIRGDKNDCLAQFLVDRDKYTLRTKEQFMSDYSTTLNNINELL